MNGHATSLLFVSDTMAITKASAKEMFVWTVNRQREMLRLAELGVDGLISDDTQLLARTFHQH